MLVSGRELLEEAGRRRCAVGCFNTYGLEITRAITAGAQACNAPVMLAVGGRVLEQAGGELLAGLVLAAAAESRCPVAVHLDHGESPEQLRRCREDGFTSLMIDGSRLPFRENVALTRLALREAGELAVEAELGGVAGDEDASGEQRTAIPMTDPDEAARFAAETRVASLAVAIGNAHGVYRGAPRLDFERLARISAAAPVPLVLHGASGLSDADLRRCIALGVRKINVNTELRQALFGSLRASLARDAQAYDLPRLQAAAVAAVQEVVERKLSLFREPA